MKTRTGFVSNSSSSSFLVTFKKGFEITPEIYEKLSLDEEEYTMESVKDLFNDFKRGGISNYEEYENYEIISNLVDWYGIQVGPSFEGGADNGDSIEYISPDELSKITQSLQ